MERTGENRERHPSSTDGLGRTLRSSGQSDRPLGVSIRDKNGFVGSKNASERMSRQRQLSRTEIADVVLSSLRDMLSRKDGGLPEAVGESTDLIGRGSLLDSLGLVTLIVDLEQRLADQYEISLTLADERAMSQKNSPFRSVRSLADYICLLMAEVQQDERL